MPQDVRVREFVRDARAAVSALARLAEAEAPAWPSPPPEPIALPERTHPTVWIAFGAALTALAFALVVLFRLVGVR